MAVQDVNFGEALLLVVLVRRFLSFFFTLSLSPFLFHSSSTSHNVCRGSTSLLYTYDPVTEAINAPSGLGRVQNATSLSLASFSQNLESQMDVDGAAAATQVTQILAIGTKESLVLMVSDPTSKDMFQVSCFLLSSFSLSCLPPFLNPLFIFFFS